LCKDEKGVEIRFVKARGDRNKNTVVFNSAGLNLTQTLVRIIVNNIANRSYSWSDDLTVRLDNLKGLFQPKWFYDSIINSLNFFTVNSYRV